MVRILQLWRHKTCTSEYITHKWKCALSSSHGLHATRKHTHASWGEGGGVHSLPDPGFNFYVLRVIYMLTLLKAHLPAFRRDESGATMVEYGLLVGLIAAVSVLIITALGGNIADYFDVIRDNTATAPTPRP